MYIMLLKVCAFSFSAVARLTDWWLTFYEKKHDSFD